MIWLAFGAWSIASGPLFVRQRIYWHGARWTPFVRVTWRYARLAYQLCQLRKDLDATQEKVAEYHRKYRAAEESARSRRDRLTALEAELLIQVKTQLQETNKLVRKQTEADLLLNALRAVGLIPQAADPAVPFPHRPDVFTEAERLQEQLARLRPTQASSSLLEGLGLGRGLETLLGGRRP